MKLSTADGVELQRNTGWQSHPAPALLREAARSVGAFQLADASADSAIIADVGAGNYSVEISTANGQSGVALAELYELDTNGRSGSLSIRGRITPTNALIGGFVVQGPARKRLLIRAVGPTLAEMGITGALADPTLTIFSPTSVVATNDRWAGENDGQMIELARKRVGAIPLLPDSEDAAVFVTLSAGAYTLEVRGKDGAEGVVVLEIYELP